MDLVKVVRKELGIVPKILAREKWMNGETMYWDRNTVERKVGGRSGDYMFGYSELAVSVDSSLLNRLSRSETWEKSLGCGKHT